MSKALLYNRIVKLEKVIQNRLLKNKNLVTQRNPPQKNLILLNGQFEIIKKRGICKKEGKNFGRVFSSETKISFNNDVYSQNDVNGSFRWQDEYLENITNASIKSGISKKSDREYIGVVDSNNDELICFFWIDECFPPQEDELEEEEEEEEEQQEVEDKKLISKKSKSKFTKIEFEEDVEPPPLKKRKDNK